VEVRSELEAFRPRLRALDTRLAAWQEQVKVELDAEFAKLNKTGEMHSAARQQEAARLALARAGDGPRRELNGTIDELCNLYLKSDAAQRAAMRSLVQENEHIFHDLWGYIRRAAEQVRAGGGELWCRFGLAVVSIEDLLGDLTDTVEGLKDLQNAAAEQGVDIAPLLKEVAALSSNQTQPGRDLSTQEFLQSFTQTAHR